MQIPPSFPVQTSEGPVHRPAHRNQTQLPLQDQTKPDAQDRLQTHHLPSEKTLTQVELWEPKDAPIQSLAEIEQLLKDVIHQSFPELKTAKIGLASLKNESVFFQSNFKPLSLFKKNKHYLIQVNPAIFKRNLPKEAAKAILAHELSHTLDYHKGGMGGIIGVGWHLISDPTCYEHLTDLQAISRGYGKGLMAYRNWVYTQIPAKDLEKKQTTYYQPHEIQALILSLEQAQNQGQATNLIQSWLNDPPLQFSEITQRLEILSGQQKHVKQKHKAGGPQ